MSVQGGPTRKINKDSGQITVPHWLRKKHGLTYRFEDAGDTVIMVPVEE